jgi:hypothetical protein
MRFGYHFTLVLLLRLLGILGQFACFFAFVILLTTADSLLLPALAAAGMVFFRCFVFRCLPRLLPPADCPKCDWPLRLALRRVTYSCVECGFRCETGWFPDSGAKDEGPPDEDAA